MPKIFCFIFARGGSKRIPKKNLKKINNKSLLEITINLAKKVNKIDKIFVSSDSKKILKIAKNNNIHIIKRPKFLCTNKSDEFASWKHAVKELKKRKILFDYFLSLPTTSPLRKKSDITRLIQKFSQTKYDVLLCATETNRYPHYNMVLRKKNTIQPIMKKSKGIKKQYFRFNNCWLYYKTEIYNEFKGIFDGKVGYVKVPRERAIDIDDFYDLKLKDFY